MNFKHSTSLFKSYWHKIALSSCLIFFTHSIGWGQCVPGSPPVWTGNSLQPSGTFADPSLIPLPTAASSDNGGTCTVTVMQTGPVTTSPSNPICQPYQAFIPYEATEGNGSTDMITGTLTAMVDPSLCVPVFLNANDAVVQCFSDVPPVSAVTDCLGNPLTPTVTTNDNMQSGANGSPRIITRSYSASTTCGGTTSMLQTITIEDTTPPIANCMDVSVALDATGNASITDNAVNNNSTDNCGTLQFSTSQTQFDCTDIGTQNVTLTVSDGLGNSATCTANVDVSETVSPTALCQDINVELDASGNANLAAAAIDNNSTDNCGAVTFSIPATSYSCANVGAGNTVTLTVTDGSNNTATCTSTITVEDKIAPTAICQIHTVILDANGNGTIAVNDINNGSSDACGIASLMLDVTTVDFNNLTTPVQVKLTVTDNNNNESDCTVDVTVVDNLPPNAVCQNRTISLNGNGNATIAATAIDNGSTDNNGNATLDFTLDVSTFDCTDIGVNIVTLTVTDDDNNSSTCNATVTVQDDEIPTAVCQNATVMLDNSGMASITAADINNGSDDNCSVASIVVSPTNFSCSPLGNNTVTLTVTDGVGNTNTCTATVSVQDNTPPTAICQNIPVSLDALGVATISANTINNGSTDNCGTGTLTLSIDVSSFDCSNTGTNNVVLTATDAAGNANSCTAVVTVSDDTDPMAMCVNSTQTININSLGIASVTVAMIDANSSDNCSIVSSTVNPSSFDCTFHGMTETVTLTVTDASGRTDNCTASVMIIDAIAPDAQCQDISRTLSNVGTVSITAAEVNNSSTDNCGTTNLSIPAASQTFDCTNIGTNNVTLTVDDGNGNSSTCVAVVTITDTVVPSAICQNVAVNLSTSGTYNLAAATIDNGSNDACGTITLSVSPNAFNCTHVGANTVTLTATDNSGNTDSCTATLTINDATNPAAMCQDFNLDLDANGMATLIPANIDGGSFDACGIATFVLSKEDFDCTDIGTQTVTLTVTDNNGRMDACTANVTTVDTVLPTALCQPVTIQLDAGGNASITSANINNGSTDNCGVGSLTITAAATNFDCNDVGTNPITLTVTDASGNSDQCDAIVTVEDVIAPTALCQDVTVQLATNGIGLIDPNDVNNGSSDICGIQSLSVSPTTVNCSNIAATVPVTLTVNDNNGLTNTCTANVTTVDMQAPTALCQDVSVVLNANNMASITTAQIDNNSTDNCTTVLTYTLSQSVFDCNDLNAGIVPVTLFVEDDFGNQGSCSANVTVTELTPTIQNCPSDINISTSGNCMVAVNFMSPTITGCNAMLVSQSHTSGSQFPQGTTPVTFTFADGNGNNPTCEFDITVTDMGAGSAPTLDCSNLNGTNQNTNPGICQANNLNLAPLSQSDDCSGSLTLSYDISGATSGNGMNVVPPSFNFNLGVSTVVYTLTDASNNSVQCSFTVSINDVEPAMPTCPANTTADTDVGLCTASGLNLTATATDNCSAATISYELTGATTAGPTNGDASVESFNAGITTVTYTATDNNNGLSSTCNFTVTVNDNQAPTVSCPSNGFTANTDAGTCSFTQTTTAFDVSFSDNCSNPTIANNYNGVDPSTLMGATFPLGTTPVTFTVSDGTNTVNCTTDVVVTDTEMPTALCNDLTLALNVFGNATIAIADLNNGSTDNCGIASITASQTTFDCTNVGVNSVTLTVIDNSGNAGTCISQVAIEDNGMPTASCQAATVEIGTNGTGTVTTAQVDNGSSDVCGLSTLSVSPMTFDCADIGVNQVVTLTVTDANNNQATCTANVTVIDTQMPTLTCNNPTVQLDANGMASISTTDVINALTDNCIVQNTTLNIATFNCTNVGNNSVTLTAMDASGNTNTCTVNVLVQENEPPVALCQDLTVQLDVNGDATITGGQINNGSTDNCGIAGLMYSVSPSTFDCSNLGVNIVTLTVSDASNNSNTCTAQVTVEDNVSPTAVCQNVTVQLNASGNASISVSDIENGSSDACGIVSSTLSTLNFTCNDVGSNTIMLTVVDFAGNNSTCNAVVTVQDTNVPTAICQNATVQLDANGDANITAMQIDNNSLATCGLANTAVAPSTFTCADLGANPVTLTITGNNGTQSTCSATVTVQDVTPPTVNCQAATVSVSSSGTVIVDPVLVNNNSTDNCGTPTFSLAPNTFTCADIGTNTVVLTGMDAAGNSSSCTTTVTVQDATSPTAVCMNATIQLDALGNATLLASQVDGGSSAPCGNTNLSVTPIAFNCANVGANTVTLTVSDNNGNSDNCTATVTVEDHVLPNTICQNATIQLDAAGNVTLLASQINNGSTDACGIAMINVAPSAFTCANVGQNTVTLTVTDVNGNAGTCNALVVVEDVTSPTVVCQNASLILDNNGNAVLTTAQINNGSTDACGIGNFTLSQTVFDCDDIGNNTVTLTINDNNGNSSQCSVTVNVSDTENPMAVCQDITVPLAANGQLILNANLVDNNSSDNCDIANLSVVPSLFDCNDLGQNTVTMTVTDVNGNTDQCTAVITIQNNNSPLAVCQDLSIQLDANGMASIVASQVDNGSSIACGMVTLAVAPSSFNCTNLGANTVVLTATASNGNSDQCTATVTVEDVTAPIATCQDITAQLGTDGTLTLNASLLNDNSSDACGLIQFSASPTAFDCLNVGANTVILSATDGSGNTGTCSSNVTIEDHTAPIALCQDISIDLDNNGNYLLNATQVDNGSSDACGILSRTVAPFAFNCSHVGQNTTTLTVTDMNGNASSCIAVVTVGDNTPPNPVCQDISISIGASGSETITAAQIDNGSTDNCGITSLTVNPSTFTCSDIGANTVTLTVTDNSSLSATCTAMVTVQNATVPTAVCQAATVFLDANGNGILNPSDVDGGSSAPCGSTTLSVTPTNFSCANIGTNIVTLSVADNNGSTATCTATVMVTDNVNPTAICQNATIQLDAAGNATLLASQINNGSNDACGIANVSVSPATYTCAELGINAVTLTVEDTNGNTSTCGALVTVEDNLAPNAICQGVLLNLDANGMAILTTAQVNNGSSDNCNVLNFSLNQTSFDCSNIGNNAVMLTVTDDSGNADNCTANVQVADNSNPNAVCQNATVQLLPNGSLTLTPSEVDGGSNDNCGIASSTVSPNTFTCNEVGTNTVTLTVLDNTGNSANCTAIVTVEGDLPPTAICQNAAVSLNANGLGSITAADVDGGSGDPCMSIALSVSPNAFDCSNVGANTVTLIATDSDGNSDQCTATVTVMDNINPVANCQNATIDLDGLGNAVVDANLINDNSTDACGIASLTVAPNTFDCTHLGGNIVTLTVEDTNGNTATCTATATIEDNVSPNALCQDLSVSLDNNGNVTIMAMQIDNGSTDNCAIMSRTLDVFNFTCSDIGANTVTLTITDNNNNSDQCTAVVTVLDDIAPTAICQNTSINITMMGMATVAAAQIDNNSTDNCGISTATVTPNTFTCNDIGTNTVTLTVTDASGNSDQCMATVTVMDATVPMAVCQDITAQLDANGSVNVTAAQIDNESSAPCGNMNFNLSPNAFTCNDLGNNTVTLTVADNNGNSDMCTAVVTIEDSVAPVAICQDVTVTLDATGNILVNANSMNNGSTDNCGTLTFSLDNSAFTCQNVGINQVVLTATDGSNNTDNCTANVNVIASPICNAQASINNSDGPMISDPCMCIGGGNFSEEVVVTSPGAGQTWMVAATNLIDPNTGSPYVVGTPLMEQPMVNGMVNYTIVGNHSDGTGYTLTATSPSYPGLELTISNTCYYPDPVIVTDLDDVLCTGDNPLPLVGNAGNAAGTGVFTLNNTVITEIDPQALGAGTYNLIYTFDAGTPGPMDPTDPGCEASVSETFEIEATNPSQACNPNVTIVLGANCEALIQPDDVLEGNNGCENDYTVTLTDQFNAPVSNPVNGTYLGQTITATVTNINTGTSCQSALAITETVPPTIVCQPITISCTEAIPAPNTGIIATDNCDPNPTITLMLETIDDDTDCTDVVPNDGVAGFVTVVRTYQAEDASGSISATCQQTITIERPEEVDFPEDVVWSCEQYAATPGVIDESPINADISAGFGTEFPQEVNTGAFDLTSMAANDPRLTQIVPGTVPPRATGSGVVGVALGTYCNYSVTSSETVIGLCGNANATTAASFKILRTFSVLDWCSGQVITTNGQGEDNIQVIVVKDHTPPVVMGADLTLSANIPAGSTTQASTTGIVPSPTVSDNCNEVASVQGFVFSDAALINSIASIDANGFLNPPVPLGSYFIAYMATDACGNATGFDPSNTNILTVIDDESPVMVCDEITDVTINSSGLATIPASVFDDGTSDNACLVGFEARRLTDNCGFNSNLSFNETVTFCCADVMQSPILVEVQASDCNGNSNVCMVQVIVNDNMSPVVSCPPNASITCNDYNDNLQSAILACGNNNECQSSVLTGAGFGNATFGDNCSATLNVFVTTSFDNCGAGAIIRNFSASDPLGNESNSCNQIITVSTVSDWGVTFGEDVELNCGVDTMTVTNAFIEPTVFNDDCEMIAVSFQDETFNTVSGACFKVVRTWRVINWCVVGTDVDQETIELSEVQLGEDLDGDGLLNPRTFRDSYVGVLPTTDTDPDVDTQDGFIEYQQEVKVVDNVAPTFPMSCPLDTVFITDNTCVGTVLLTTPAVDDCVGAANVTVTAFSGLGVGFGPFVNVTPGAYPVTFQAADNCGNTSTCVQNVVVVDAKFPSPVCVDGLVLELMSINDPNNTSFEPMIQVATNQINAGSFDNCPGGLNFSFEELTDTDTLTFNCNNVGSNTVSLYVTDANGLQSFCTTQVEIQANQNQCDNIGDLLVIAGNVATEEVVDVENVMVQINSSTLNMEYLTDAAGMYEVNAPIDNDYTITPVKDDDYLNGVTTLDLVKITKHILNIQSLDSPYKMIAADANKSNSITTLDLVRIRKLILHIEDDFGDNTSWRFVDATYAFPDPANPWEEVFPEIINVNNLETDLQAEDFIAIKIGDVNNSAQANGLLGADDRTQGALRFQVENQQLEAGESYEIPVYADNFHHVGYQFTLNFAPEMLAITGIGEGLAKRENFGFRFVEEGKLTTSWHQANGVQQMADEAIFTLKIVAKKQTSLQEALSISSDYTQAEAYSIQGDFEGVELNFLNTDSATGLVLHQNRPNPFEEQTTIGFELPKESAIQLVINDLSGRVIYELAGQYQKGYHEIILDKAALQVKGILYYQLQTEEESLVRKMIVME